MVTNINIVAKRRVESAARLTPPIRMIGTVMATVCDDGGIEAKGGRAGTAIATLPAAAWVTGCIAVFWVTLRHQDIVAAWLDRPAMSWINQFAVPSAFVNHAIEYTSDLPTFTGAFIVTLFAWCWFASERPDRRTPLLLGLGAAVAAVVVSRVLQIALPTHLRPLHDAGLGFVAPVGVDPAALNTWSSFPSDHAAIYFALTAVVWRASRPLGVLALLSTLFATLPRIYLGFHYPSDIAAGAILGIAVVVLVAIFGPARLARRMLAWGETRPAAFHAAGFMLCYQVATLFVDIRRLGWIDPRHLGLDAAWARGVFGL
jgi:undecaprenyl-diphosphatase